MEKEKNAWIGVIKYIFVISCVGGILSVIVSFLSGELTYLQKCATFSAMKYLYLEWYHSCRLMIFNLSFCVLYFIFLYRLEIHDRFFMWLISTFLLVSILSTIFVHILNVDNMFDYTGPCSYNAGKTVTLEIPKKASLTNNGQRTTGIAIVNPCDEKTDITFQNPVEISPYFKGKIRIKITEVTGLNSYKCIIVKIN